LADVLKKVVDEGMDIEEEEVDGVEEIAIVDRFVKTPMDTNMPQQRQTSKGSKSTINRSMLVPVVSTDMDSQAFNSKIPVLKHDEAYLQSPSNGKDYGDKVIFRIEFYLFFIVYSYCSLS